MKHAHTRDSSWHPAIIPAAVIAAGLAMPSAAGGAAGDLDPSFGDVGRVGLDVIGAIWSIEAEESGYLLTGQADMDPCYYYYSVCEPESFNERVLPDGSLDDGFAVEPVEDLLLFEAVPLTDGKTVLVGQIGERARVLRLRADGVLAPTFGADGLASIRMQTPWPVPTSISDLDVLADGTVVVGGSAGSGYAAHPFAARLLAEGATGGPGVLTQRTGWLEATEDEGVAIVTVQRIGGSTGTVSVDIAARLADWGTPAQEDADFGALDTTLTWADGDRSDKQVVIALPADEGPEYAEHFLVELTNPQGGAGLGATLADVTIRGDGYPAGVFSVSQATVNTLEGSRDSQFMIERHDYSQGAVSVTLTPVDGTATAGSDYEAAPLVFTWADGELGVKYALFAPVQDDEDEATETIVVEISAPTGGALIGESSRARSAIRDATIPGNSGGGRLDLIGLLLALAAGMRRRLIAGLVEAGRLLDGALLGGQRRPTSRRSESR